MPNRSIAVVCGAAWGVVLLAAVPVAAQSSMADSGPAIIEVSPDNQIVNNSRGGVARTQLASQLEPGPGTWVLGDDCADQTQCLHQTISRGGLCGAAESLELIVTNKCTQPAAFGVCAERMDGSWECALHKKLTQGKVEKHAVATCHATGRYNLRGTKASDLARDANCLISGPAAPIVSGVVQPNATPPQEEPEAPLAPQSPGACTRAKACCRALSNVEGMRSLDNACAQMNPLDDQTGAAVCQQIMLLIQGSISPLPKIPAACR